MSLTPSNAYLHCSHCKQSFQLPSPFHPVMTYQCPKCQKALQIVSSPSRDTSALQGDQEVNLTPSSRPGYQIQSKLGEGGFGRVYKVKDPLLKRSVALKILRQSKMGDILRKKRFMREIMITSQLDHPNIMPVYEGGHLADGTLYFTMRELQGSTLKELLEPIKGKRKTSLGELVQIFLKVCEAVEYAHSKDIVHRDLKPSNIAVGNFGEVIVLDWGLAKYIGEEEGKSHIEELEGTYTGEDISRDGSMIGTPAYMSPEQAGGEGGVISPRSDLYSLGAILYQILAEEPPYYGATQKILTSLLMEAPKLPSKKRPDLKIPRPLEAIAMKALEKKPSLRYGSVAQMIGDIRAYLEDLPVSVYQPSWSERALKKIRHHALMLMVLMVLTLGGALFIYILSQVQIEAQRSQIALEQDKARSQKKLLEMEQDKNRLQRERFKAEEAKLEAEKKENEEKKKRIEFMTRYQKALTPYLVAKDHFAQDMGFIFIKKHVIPHFKKAITIHPEFIEARWDLIKIYIYLDLQDMVMAEMSQLSAIIAKHSKEGKGTRLSQIIMQAMFNPSLAAKDLEFIAHFDRYKPDFVPDLFWYPMQAMFFFSLKQYDEALKIIDEVIEKYKLQTWDIFALKAFICIQAQKYKMSLTILNGIIEKYPAIPFPYMMRNFCYQKLKKGDDFLKNSRIIISRDPSCYIVWHDLAIYSLTKAREFPKNSDQHLAYLLARVRYFIRILILEKKYVNSEEKINDTLKSIQKLLFKTNKGPLVKEKYIDVLFQRIKNSKSDLLKKEFSLLGYCNIIGSSPYWSQRFGKAAQNFLIQYLKRYPQDVDEIWIREALQKYGSE